MPSDSSLIYKKSAAADLPREIFAALSLQASSAIRAPSQDVELVFVAPLLPYGHTLP